MTPTRAWAVVLLLLAGALAGCLGPSDGEDVETAGTDANRSAPADEDSDEPEPSPNATSQTHGSHGPRVATTWGNLTVQGVRVGTGGWLGLGPNTFPFDVGPNASAVVVELGWNATNDVQIDVDPPDRFCNATASPDPIVVGETCPTGGSDRGTSSPVRVELGGEEVAYPGAWEAAARPLAAPQGLEVTFAASVIHGDLDPGTVARLGSS